MEILKKVNSRTICFGLKYSTPWMKPNIPVQHMLRFSIVGHDSGYQGKKRGDNRIYF